MGGAYSTPWGGKNVKCMGCKKFSGVENPPTPRQFTPYYKADIPY